MDPLYWAGSIGVTIIIGFLFGRKIDKSYEPVSYTHLTLPTSDLV